MVESNSSVSVNPLYLTPPPSVSKNNKALLAASLASLLDDDSKGPAVTAKDSWILLVIDDKVASIPAWVAGPGCINTLTKVTIWIIFWNIGSNKFNWATMGTNILVIIAIALGICSKGGFIFSICLSVLYKTSLTPVTNLVGGFPGGAPKGTAAVVYHI